MSEASAPRSGISATRLDAHKLVDDAHAAVEAEVRRLMARIVRVLNRFAQAARDRGEHDYARWLLDIELPRWVHVENELLARLGSAAHRKENLAHAQATVTRMIGNLTEPTIEPMPPLGSPEFDEWIGRLNSPPTPIDLPPTPVPQPGAWGWIVSWLADLEAGGLQGEQFSADLDQALQARYKDWVKAQSGPIDAKPLATDAPDQPGSSGRSRKANANARLVDYMVRHPESTVWSARKLADALGYKSPSTVKETKTWKELAKVRAVAKAESMLGRAERAVGHKRRR
jgi:hypothetical protein